MTPSSLRLAVVVCLLGLAIPSLGGCGGGQPKAGSTNVSVELQPALVGSAKIEELRSGLSNLPFEVEFDGSTDLADKGFVAGTLISRRGIRSTFALRFGEGGVLPVKVVRRLDSAARAPDMDIGQGFVNGVDYAFTFGGADAGDDWSVRHRMRTQAIETACVVSTGEACDWIGPIED